MKESGRRVEETSQRPPVGRCEDSGFDPTGDGSHWRSGIVWLSFQKVLWLLLRQNQSGDCRHNPGKTVAAGIRGPGM